MIVVVLQFEAEYRRFALKRNRAGGFQEFYQLLQTIHRIPGVDVLLGYADIHGDLLPINNDDNFHKALSSANPLLRIIIQRRGKLLCSMYITKRSTFDVILKLTGEVCQFYTTKWNWNRVCVADLNKKQWFEFGEGLPVCPTNEHEPIAEVSNFLMSLMLTKDVFIWSKTQ